MPIAEISVKEIDVDKAIEELNKIGPQYMYDVEEMQMIFDEAIEQASYVVRNIKANFLKRWWNQEIQKAYNIKRACLKKHNREKSLQSQLAFQESSSQTKKTDEVGKTKRYPRTEIENRQRYSDGAAVEHH